jgi:regulatory protein
LDDTAFVRFWVQNRLEHRPRSPSALRYELLQKGVDRELIDRELRGLDEDDLAWAAVRGRLDRWRTLDHQAFYAKAMGFLRRRGFGYEAAKGACDRAWEEQVRGE